MHSAHLLLTIFLGSNLPSCLIELVANQTVHVNTEDCVKPEVGDATGNTLSRETTIYNVKIVF
jgi:hypothetical protein